MAEPAVDNEGYLLDPGEWTEDWARRTRNPWPST